MVGEVLAGGVDVVHLVSEVPEVAAAGIALGVPVVSELHLRRLVAGSREEHQREAALRAVLPRQLLQTERVTVEPQ